VREGEALANLGAVGEASITDFSLQSLGRTIRSWAFLSGSLGTIFNSVMKNGLNILNAIHVIV
jgi:hypothetical protein